MYRKEINTRLMRNGRGSFGNSMGFKVERFSVLTLRSQGRTVVRFANEAEDKGVQTAEDASVQLKVM